MLRALALPIRRLLVALAVAALPVAGWAQPPGDCKFGQRVTYQPNNYGLVVSGRDGLCLVRSIDGAKYDWVPLGQLSIAVDPPLPAGAPTSAAAGPAAGPAPPEAAAGPTTIIRPGPPLTYRAERGQVMLTAEVNGAPVRFLVDTGANLVSLTPKDAEAAGIKTADLMFNLTVHTANGTARAALVKLREIRLDRSTAVENVAASVQEGLPRSLLGMSFLQRLKGFEMREGALTISR